jgi:hypothetical protein
VSSKKVFQFLYRKGRKYETCQKNLRQHFQFNDVLQKSFNRAGLVEKADLDFVQMIYGVEVF